MKSAFLAMLAPALTVAACATAPLTLNDNQIVRGERVGDVEIGMSLSSLMALKGTPLRTIPIKDTAATTYVFDGLTVGAHDEVYWIIAKDARFRTADGVAPGAEQIAARGALGQPQCVVSRPETTIYDYGDLYFEVQDATGKVSLVGVQAETQNCNG